MGSVLSINKLCALGVLYICWKSTRNVSSTANDNAGSESAHIPLQSELSGRSGPFYAAHGFVVTRSTFSEVHGDQHNVNNITMPNMDSSADEERRFQIANWLSPFNFKSNQVENLQLRENGTGQWLLESKEFKNWLGAGTSKLEGKSEMLCLGIPGAGKTVLTSVIVDDLQARFKNDNVAILCIYCNYKERTEQTTLNLIASLLKQLVQDYPVAYDNIKALYGCHVNQQTRLSLDEVIKELKSEIGRFSRVFIVVDALDECYEVAQFLALLRSLPDNVNLLVTSRPLRSIEDDFAGTQRLDIRANESDVRTYIECRIPYKDRLARHVKGHPGLQEEIVSTIIKNVQGMFLLARLYIDWLETMNSRQEIREALRSLPTEVSTIYKQIMKRIDGQTEKDRKLAELVLSWIIYAHRQLSLEELQHAIAVVTVREITKIEPHVLVDEATLTSVCAGLVVVEKESRIVHLVHYTAQEFFENTRESRFPKAQATITETCIRYLSFNVFRRYSCRNHRELKSFIRSNALLDYAATYWGHHARGPVEERMEDMVFKFVQDYPELSCVHRVLLHSRYPLSKYNLADSPKISRLHLSCFYGLEHTTRKLLLDGDTSNLNSTDMQDFTPLCLAVKEGHEPVVKLLLGADDINVNLGHHSPLYLAAMKGHEAMVKLLLAHDKVDVNLKDDKGRTALSVAEKKRHRAVVKLLKERNDEQR